MGNSSISSNRQPEDSKETLIDPNSYKSLGDSPETSSDSGVVTDIDVDEGHLCKVSITDLEEVKKAFTFDLLDMTPVCSNYVLRDSDDIIIEIYPKTKYKNDCNLFKHMKIKNKNSNAYLWFTEPQIEKIKKAIKIYD